MLFWWRAIFARLSTIESVNRFNRFECQKWNVRKETRSIASCRTVRFAEKANRRPIAAGEASRCTVFHIMFIAFHGASQHFTAFHGASFDSVPQLSTAVLHNSPMCLAICKLRFVVYRPQTIIRTCRLAPAISRRLMIRAALSSRPSGIYTL